MNLMARHRQRLQVVSNFGNGVCGAGEIHTRMRVRNFEATRREGSAEIFGAPFASRCREISHAHVCVYFARPTIAIVKTRDYSQSTCKSDTKLCHLMTATENPRC